MLTRVQFLVAGCLFGLDMLLGNCVSIFNVLVPPLVDALDWWHRNLEWRGTPVWRGCQAASRTRANLVRSTGGAADASGHFVVDLTRPYLFAGALLPPPTRNLVSLCRSLSPRRPAVPCLWADIISDCVYSPSSSAGVPRPPATTSRDAREAPR